MYIIQLREFPGVGKYKIKSKDGILSCYYNNETEPELVSESLREAKEYCGEQLKKKHKLMITINSSRRRKDAKTKSGN